MSWISWERMLKGSVPPKEEKGRLDKPQQWAKKQAPTT